MSFASLYDRIFDAAAGRHPGVRITHHQFLATRDLHRDLREVLPSLSGTVIDLGSRSKPYGSWLGAGVTDHIGIDVAPGPGVDVVIATDQRLPFADSSIDGVLCTQVLEFVSDPDGLVAEIARCLRPGGRLILSVPFTANQHGAGDTDLVRFSAAGVRGLVGRSLVVDDVRRQGGIGSTTTVLLLNWVRVALSGNKRWLRGPLLPLLLVLHAVANAAGMALDAVDRTGHFYGNVLVVAHREAS